MATFGRPAEQAVPAEHGAFMGRAMPMQEAGGGDLPDGVIPAHRVGASAMDGGFVGRAEPLTDAVGSEGDTVPAQHVSAGMPLGGDTVPAQHVSAGMPLGGDT
ncbi:hypothetical protein ABT095_22250, partial [Kitasatospora sp. NPDC002227]|uniref:hypothetical protein n=1 Tax=Kitasatospora sp. NPDC002227 TaxID=3154773 RepID=UPI003333C984